MSIVVGTNSPSTSILDSYCPPFETSRRFFNVCKAAGNLRPVNIYRPLVNLILALFGGKIGAVPFGEFVTSLRSYVKTRFDAAPL